MTQPAKTAIIVTRPDLGLACTLLNYFYMNEGHWGLV